jgi:hypothetical protein
LLPPRHIKVRRVQEDASTSTDDVLTQPFTPFYLDPDRQVPDGVFQGSTVNDVLAKKAKSQKTKAEAE